MYINKKDTDIINHPDPKQSSLQSGKKRKQNEYLANLN